MEHLINILVIDDTESDIKALKEILSGGGSIILNCECISEAYSILDRKEVGIILINIDSPKFSSMDEFKALLDAYPLNVNYSIVITENTRAGSKLLRGFNSGAVDFISKPFNPHLIQAKIDVYKALYYKDQRITQLLGNILPRTVLEDLNQYGKFSPKRVDNGVVLFTDFVDFSMKSKSIKPLKLVKKLEHYFTQFDEIVERYKLEKIKTIGDAYMALAGVTETNEEPILRACLAAMEMRDFIRNDKEVAKALKRDFWEIRIGIHSGPLVAGIIGSKRYSFDVWGDSVNIAARAQQFSAVDEITVTDVVHKEVEGYFHSRELGNVPIKKRGGTMELFSLEKLRTEFSLYGRGKLPNVQLRKQCNISTIDFMHMRNDIINRLKSNLPDEVVYHDLAHTINVEKAAIRIGKLEGLDEDEMLLVRTAALYHDSGFIFTHERNELHGVRLMEQNLPKYGYNDQQISVIRDMILATTPDIEPKNLLEEIICDADHDYLGRADYYVVSGRLKEEFDTFGKVLSETEWIEMQIRFLQDDHVFYTVTAQNIRERGKQNRIRELKVSLAELS